MTTLAPVQVAPRVRRLPDGATDTGFGDEAAGLLRMVGFDPDPWQVLVLRDQLSRRGGRWAGRDQGLVVPRQNGKGVVLLGEALWCALLGPPGTLTVYSSHSFRQATEFWRMLAGAAQHPAVRRRIRKLYGSHGEEGVETHTGSRVRIMARGLQTFRGYSIDTLLLDEAFALDDERWASVLPTMSARPDPRVVLVSSAGNPDSVVLNRFRARAIAGDHPGLVWHEWSAPDGLDDADPRALELANPALGGRLTVEACEAERQTMAAPDFARERLGRWQYLTSRPVDLALDPKLFDACVDGRVGMPPLGADVVLAFDCVPGRRGSAGAASAVVACWQENGTVHGVLVQAGLGAAWLLPRLRELRPRWSPDRPVLFNAAAGVRDVAVGLERAGIPTEGLGSTGYVDACADLSRRLTEHDLRVAPSPGFAEAVPAAARRKLGLGWVFDPASDVSVAPLVGLAVGCWQLRSARVVAEPMVF